MENKGYELQEEFYREDSILFEELIKANRKGGNNGERQSILKHTVAISIASYCIKGSKFPLQLAELAKRHNAI